MTQCRFVCCLVALLALTISTLAQTPPGPAELQAIALMLRHDMRAIGHGSADYCHLLVECMKLAYADREQYYGDPAQTLVPSEVLLSDAYTAERAKLVDPRHANPKLRPGDARRNAALLPEDEILAPKGWGAGTVHVDAVDAQGNMASFTPSGAWLMSAENTCLPFSVAVML